MPYLYKRIIQGIALTLGIATLAVATVSAAPNDNATTNRPTTVSATTTVDATSTESTSEGTTATTNREKAKELLQEKRASRTERTAAQKKKSCESRAASINNKATKYAAQGQKHLDVFDKIFTRVQTFKTDKQLNVAGYDELVAAATAKQAAAEEAVEALKELDVSIDCTQADPAAAVATLKTATGTARTALQDYRKSIKDVVVALKGASTAQKESSTTETSGDDASDTTTETTTDTTTTEGAQ